jgi:hypothetical protein
MTKPQDQLRFLLFASLRFHLIASVYSVNFLSDSPETLQSFRTLESAIDAVEGYKSSRYLTHEQIPHSIPLQSRNTCEPSGNIHLLFDDFLIFMFWLGCLHLG